MDSFLSEKVKQIEAVTPCVSGKPRPSQPAMIGLCTCDDCCFLCGSFEHKVEHYQIQRDSRDWVSVDGEEYFENLVKLVEVVYVP